MEATQLKLLAKCLDAAEPGNAYMLVDPALCNDIRLRAPLGVTFARLPLPGVDDDESISVLPTLMAWPRDHGLRNWLLERSALWAEEQHAVTWLRSRIGLESLANRLGSGIAAILDDGLEVMLRIADARVLPVMHDCLSSAQRARLFGEVERWWYLDREEKLQTLPLATEADSKAIEPAALPLTLTQAQLDRLLDAAEPDSVMKVLRDSFPGKLEKLPRVKQHAFVLGQITRAKLWGLERPGDLASFCVLACESGEEFSERPPWAAWREQVRSGKMSWVNVLIQEGR